MPGIVGRATALLLFVRCRSAAPLGCGRGLVSPLSAVRLPVADGHGEALAVATE